MLDIVLFRKNPEIIRESQRRRFASVELVDEIIMLDEAWRKPLDDIASKTCLLELHFPALDTYKEVASFSNSTDYVSRRLGMRFGQEKSNEEETEERVHMLHSNLIATERTVSCILENYQREDGVQIPEVLQPFMDGIVFLPFKAAKNKDFCTDIFSSVFFEMPSQNLVFFSDQHTQVESEVQGST